MGTLWKVASLSSKVEISAVLGKFVFLLEHSFGKNLCVCLREFLGCSCCDQKNLIKVIVYERFLNAHVLPFQLVIIAACGPQTRFRFPCVVDVLKKMTFGFHIIGTREGARRQETWRSTFR